MDGTLTLFVVLALLYLAEIPTWIGPASLGIRTLWSKRGTPLLPGGSFGAWDGGIHFVGALPVGNALFITHLPPITISPEGFWTTPPQFTPPGTPPSPASQFVSFDQIDDLRRDDRKLLFRGKTLLKFPSAGQARITTSFLRQLAAVPAVSRPKLIRRDLRRSFDLKALRKRIESFHSAASPLNWTGGALFTYLFAAAPLAIRQWGLLRIWLPMLGGLVWLVGIHLYFFVRGHKRLLPEDRGDLWLHLLRMILSPPAAIRARDVLASDCLAGFHPVAASFRLSPADDSQKLAGAFLRDLSFPIKRDEDDPELAAAANMTRKGLVEEIERCVTRAGGEVKTLLAHPSAPEQGCHTYCPRCLTQFVHREGTCSDCLGVQLKSMSDPD